VNWIERGNVEDIENIHNMDRARALAAMILLAEIVLVYWFSPELTLPLPGGSPGGLMRTRLVSMASIVTWPAVPDAISTEPVATKDEVFDENPGTGGDNSDSTSAGTADSDGRSVPDDIRIVSISPPPTIPLWVGDMIGFEVEVEYNLASASSSPLSMLIEECSCDAPPPQVLPVDFPRPEPARFRSRASATAQKGRRMQTLTKRIRVPVAEALNITVKLGDESASSGPSDTKLYKVVDAGRPPTGNSNSVRIASIRPPAGTLLHNGDNVEFEVVIDYNLPGDAAILGLTLQTGSQSIAEMSEPVKKGQRRMVFRERARIPDTVPGATTTVVVTVRLGEAESRETIDFKIAGR
jgi:hypothetical protein